MNSELLLLEEFLDFVLEYIHPSGRLVIISYHSLEDRLVKEFFKVQSSSCVCPPSTPLCVCGHTPTLEVLTRRVVRPNKAEIAVNPRSRSARLRAAKVLPRQLEVKLRRKS